MLRKSIALLTFMTIAVPAAGQDLNWPTDLVQRLNDASAGVAAAQTVDERAAAIAPIQAALRDNAKSVPGAALMLHMTNIEINSDRAFNALESTFSDIATADAGTLQDHAADILAALSGLTPPGSSGQPPTPSAAGRLMDAVDRYDEAAESVGAPSIRELVTDALPEEVGSAVNDLLDRATQLRDLRDNLEDIAEGDTDAVDDFVEGVFDLLPTAAGPAFSSVVGDAFVDTMQWNAEMWDASTDGIDIVADAIENGRVDTERLRQVEDRLNDLRSGPWGSDLARDAANRLCDLLPDAVSGLCQDLFEEVAEIFEGETCEAIDCDCGNVGSGLLAGPERVTCEIQQQDLQLFCQANNRIEGVCEPGGPAAFPR